MRKIIYTSLLIIFPFFSIYAQDSLAHYTIVELDSLCSNADLTDESNEQLKHHALALQERAKAESNDLAYARGTYFLATYYNSIEEDYERALELHQEALKIQKSQASGTTEHGEILLAIANIYAFVYDDMKLAEPFLFEAKDILEKDKDALDSHVLLYNCLAKLYREQGEFDTAEELYRKTLDIIEVKEGADSYEYAAILMNILFMKEMNGETEGVDEMYQEIIEITAKTFGKVHEQYAYVLYSHGDFLFNTGFYERAEVAFYESLYLHEQLVGKEDYRYVYPLSGLAKTYMMTGRLDEAKSLFLEAIAVHSSIFGTEDATYTYLLDYLGQAYLLLKEYNAAKEVYQEALAIDKKIYGEEHYNYTATLKNSAYTFLKMEMHEDAEQLFLEALDIHERQRGIEHIEYISTSVDLALMYLDAKEYDKTEQLCLDNINKENINDLYKVIGLNLLVKVYLKKEDYATAKSTLQQAILLNNGVSIYDNDWDEQLKGALSVKFDYLAESLESFYDLASAGNDVEEQLRIINVGLFSWQRYSDNLSDDEDKKRAFEEISSWAERGIALSLKNEDQAFYYAEIAKAALLREAIQNENAYYFGGLPDSLRLREKELLQSRDALSVEIQRNRVIQTEDSLIKELNIVNRNLDQLKKEVEADYPKYASFKYEKDIVALQEIQATLKERDALVQYVLGEDATYVLYADKKGSKVIPLDIMYEDITVNVKMLRNALTNYPALKKDPETNYKNYTEIAYWFYQQLIEPLTIGENIEHLIIIPDKELGHLPFETFLTEEANDRSYNELPYLLAQYEVSYNYSANLWKLNQIDQAIDYNGLVMAAAPYYPGRADSSLASFRSPSDQNIRKFLEPLPAAQEEVTFLKNMFEGRFVFDSMATESIFKQDAANYSVIHLAMHGLLSQRVPNLSSLAFTEDGDSLENNFLHAYEISKLDLNAALVVLSACETGYGKFETGNGIASLARSFMYAGVPAMVVSLWEVNDKVTADLMKNFYINLSNGASKPNAIRQAKLDYIETAQGNLAHPAYWSPFIQIGNEEPIEIKTKGGCGSTLLWWIIGGSTAFLGLFIIVKSKKKEV